jgi:hypothetical protein
MKCREKGFTDHKDQLYIFYLKIFYSLYLMGIMEEKKRRSGNWKMTPPKQALGFSKCLPFIDEVIPLNKVPSNYTERFGGGHDVLIGLPNHFVGKSYKHFKREKKTRTLQKKEKNKS